MFGALSKENIPAPNGWQCDRCYYEHPDPATDPFYQDQVKGLMYFCAVILVFVSVKILLRYGLCPGVDPVLDRSRTLSGFGSRYERTHPRSGRTLNS